MKRRIFVVLILTALVAGNGFAIERSATASDNFVVSFDSLTLNTTGATCLMGAGALSPLSVGGRTPNDDGLHFTALEKLAAAISNVVLGLGSFRMGDTTGGFITGGIQTVGWGIMLVAALTGQGFTPLDYTGLGIWSVGILYGFIRPFSFDRRISRAAGTIASNPMNGITFTPVAKEDGRGMGLFYNMSF